MMAASAKPMHQDFPSWYQTVSLGDNAARRQGRWEGVLNVVTNADWATVEALLRLAYGTRQPPLPSTVQSIRQGFKAADETFEMNGNDRELQVLAGVCLAVLMDNLEAEEASSAALAATTTALGAGRTSDLPMDLASLGERAITVHGEERRKRPLLGKYTSNEPPKLDFEKSATKVREQPNWEGVMEAFSLAADSTRIAFKALAMRQAQAVRAADDFIRVQDEELQMLWWLTSQYSEGYGCAFNSVPADAQPFVFASELADATETLPGPPSVKAILSRAGLKERKKVLLTAAVNALSAEWLQRMVEGKEPSPISTPLHFAIKRQLETGPGEAWVAGWAAATGIDAQYALPGLTLGELFYRERLLLLFG